MDTVKSIMLHDDIKVISFDILDTLLERPALYPTDIFVLLNNSVKALLKKEAFDFYKVRRALEKKVRRTLASSNRLNGDLSFVQLYEEFGSMYHLSEAQKDEIAALELRLEQRLLSVRKLGRELFHAAVATGKRIICMSDMYHSPEFFENILLKNGFEGIARIYVSSREGKRKDTGELFDFVLRNEHLNPPELFHVGDNYHSDHLIPSRRGIVSYHLPSSKELFYASRSEYRRLWHRHNAYSPHERLIMGFYINRWGEKLYDPTSFFPEKQDLGYFGLGPVLFAIAQYLKSNTSIQQDYSLIHFASRDGYLPMKAYDLLCKNEAKYIRSCYIYCGRSLYNICHYNTSALQYIMNRLDKYTSEATFTMGHLFDSLCSPDFLSESDPRRNILIRDEIRNGCLNIKAVVSDRHDEIEALLENKYNNVKYYYISTVQSSTNDRAVIFDCGYDGSVSDCIGRVTGKIVDKVYIWETYVNRYRDKRNKSRTYVLADDKAKVKKYGMWLAFEELFSSSEGSCIDIQCGRDQCQPVFDSATDLAEGTKRDLAVIQTAALEFVQDIKDGFGEFLDAMEINNISFSLAPMESCLTSLTDMSIRHLEGIVFPDLFFGNVKRLSEKLDLSDRQHFLRTHLVDLQMLISRPRSEREVPDHRIGIELHLIHVEQAACIIDRLKGLEVGYDLLISVCSEKDARIARVLFNKSILKRTNRVVIKADPDLDQGAAPWTGPFRDRQDHFDLLCHIHIMKSPQNRFDDQWRDFLLDNLISREAVGDIIRHFEADAGLGIVFPPSSKSVMQVMVQKGVSSLGDNQERTLLQRIVKRMRINKAVGRHKAMSSAAMMFWYRPVALKALFAKDGKHIDLARESDMTDRSSIHSIDCLPSVAANNQGYRTRYYLKQDVLLDQIVDRMIEVAAQNLHKTRYHLIRGKLKEFLTRDMMIYLSKAFPVGSYKCKMVKSMLKQYPSYILGKLKRARS